MKFEHKPVLLEECILNLNIQPNGIYVDGTLGGAGHSKEIVKKLDETGLLIGIDRDEDSLKAAKNNLKEFSNVKYIHGNHDDIKEILQQNNIQKVNGILLDLGMSSYQIDEPQRGFSYMNDGKLDMRMDVTQDFCAKDIVNTYSEEELSKIFFEYGEERQSKQIAKAIVIYRNTKKIETTGQLVDIIKNVKYVNPKEGHPAKKVFQALRIETNNEIEPLKNTIKDSIDMLLPEGRLCVITFHSLEDRIVKQAYIEAEGICTCPKDLPYCVCNVQHLGKIINKKPIIASEEEQQMNSRSKSAKLRIFEKTKE